MINELRELLNTNLRLILYFYLVEPIFSYKIIRLGRGSYDNVLIQFYSSNTKKRSYIFNEHFIFIKNSILLSKYEYYVILYLKSLSFFLKKQKFTKISRV